MEGSLSKWTNVMKGWQYRWFVLDEGAGLFSYYTSRDKMVRGVRRGCVRLRGAVIGIDDEDEATFTVTVDGKTFHFQAHDSEEREKWIRALEDTVLRHNQVRRPTSSLRKGAASSSLTSIDDFEKKLGETDGYLELLLAQMAKIKGRAEDPAASEQARQRYERVLGGAQDMTESIKHAIVLLQIAKNAAVPDAPNAVKDLTQVQLQMQQQQQAKTDAGKTVTEVTDSAAAAAAVTAPTTSSSSSQQQAPPAAAAKDNQKSPLAPRVSSSGSLKPDKKSAAIPEISYSSSDDDDDFFDAEEDDDDVGVHLVDAALDGGVGIPVAVLQDPNKLELKLAAEDPSSSLQSPLTPRAGVDDENIDYDALYDVSDDTEDVDMKSHGSVITHLLSQVRIGMDLTKIVLPTFILERRSLLEMYSDFFAHPDLFLSIPEGRTPEDRMVRVLRWYLSSFHAGRKSSIAKKPYNPIIGETFRCHWRLGDDDAAGAPVTDGPVPWAGDNDLTFVAEQVSHHPPVSGFYAEHKAKRISVNAHIYTKSAFLGMSIAVHNLGQGKLLLMDHDEEYVCTFPSAYARSILTVPWVELGGKVAINCVKTNYIANLEFKCKQFFSSDVNKLTAEVISPHTKKPVLKVEGEWNGRMMAKWATGKNEVFIDVGKMAIHPKAVRPVREQARFESRRLWKDVTYGLKVNDISMATAEKTKLEQRQREEAAERKEKGAQWETKLFRPIGENWQYMTPLEKRLMEQKQ